MPCLSGFELHSRWEPLINAYKKIIAVKDATSGLPGFQPGCYPADLFNTVVTLNLWGSPLGAPD